MSSLVKMAQPCFDQHHQVDDHTAKYVKAVKARYSKEITAKCNRAGCGNHSAIIRHFMSPWIFAYGCSPMFNMSVHQYSMITGDQMRPLPCLATQERKSAQNGQDHIFLNAFPVHLMAFVYRQYHGNRTEDEDKGHQTHKGKRQVRMAGQWKCIKDMVWIGPAIYTETDSSITDQECSKGEGITH